MTIARRPGQFNTQDTSGIRQMMRYLAVIMFVAFLSGCSTMLAHVPMDVLTYENPNKALTNQRLIVFLRGIGGSHQSFEEEGLVSEVWARDLPFDMVAPDAHFGYYGDRNLVIRLKKDVIDPARAKGYQKIWLVGVSMGGLGAMLYLMEWPDDIAGVYLISPFLGSQFFLNEIEAAGGVRKWDPGPYKTEEDWQRMLWHWMKTTIADNPKKIVYLGYGTDDTYKNGPQLLSALLPPNRVYAIEGGHDYQTFKALWKIFLENDRQLRN
jgi:pimeloyl-ACP methyl ester carboxylesterase